jgi:hypothetical protein
LEEAGTEQMPLAQQSVQFAETTESMASFILGQSAAPKSELINREFSPDKNDSDPPCDVDYEAGSSLGAEHSNVKFSVTYQSQTTYTAILPNDEICYEISVERAEIVNFESDELGALESINQSTSLEEAGTEQMPLAQQSVQFAETTESMASFILGQSAAPKSELIDRELSPGKYDPEDMNVQHKVGFEKGTGSDDFLEANERNQYGNHFNGRTSPVKKTKLQNHDNAEQLNAPPSLAKDGAMLGNGTNKDIPSDATLQEHLEIEDPKNTTVVQNVLIESSDDDATLSEAASDSPDIKAVKKGEEMIKMEETRHNTASHANRTSRKRVLAMRKIILSSLSDIRFNCVHRNTDDDNWTCTLCNISSLSVFSVVEHCQGKKHTKSCDAMLPGMESNNENLKTVTAFSLGEPNRLSYADVVKKIQLITGSTKPNVSVFSQSRESLQSIRDVVDHVQAPEHKLSTWTLERQQNELINVASPAPVSEETIAEDLDEEEKSMLRQLLLMHTPSSCFEVLTKEANEIRTEESPMFPDTPFNSPIAQSNIHISPSFSYLLDASLGYIIEKEGSQKVNHDDTILGSVFQNENVAEFVQSEASLKQNTQENDILECQTARQCIAALAYFNLLTPKRSFGPLN